MNRTRATVADLKALKGTRQMTMVYVENTDEARACAAAGVDILSIEAHLWDAEMRDAAGDCFVQVGLPFGVLATTDEYLRAGHDLVRLGADACYCAASTQIIARLSAEGIPIVGHVGLIPSRRTWTGGFRAVGKTLESARQIAAGIRALEQAGAFAAEIEVVPEPIATALSQRTSLVLLSMGAGTGCDAQYLFSCDLLGYTAGHRPRHAKVYRDFRSEFDRLQAERIAAFGEFVSDVSTGAYPEPQHLVPVDDQVVQQFVEFLDGEWSG
jgi:3-methyl-2-oxobutanoate hydroxymethyltransferase